jgi:hypothetical protein
VDVGLYGAGVRLLLEYRRVGVVLPCLLEVLGLYGAGIRLRLEYRRVDVVLRCCLDALGHDGTRIRGYHLPQAECGGEQVLEGGRDRRNRES